MGLRAIIYFEIVTTLALFIGLAAVNILRPGVGVVLPAEAGAPGVGTTAQTWDQILLHLVPTSIIEAMATGDILQIVVFSIVFAIGLGMPGEKGRPMIEWCESLTEAMFKVTTSCGCTADRLSPRLATPLRQRPASMQNPRQDGTLYIRWRHSSLV